MRRPTKADLEQAYINGRSSQTTELMRLSDELRVLKETVAARETKLKLVNAAGQALQANANALEAVARMLDNLGAV